MALKTLGSNANNSLNALVFLHGMGISSPADTAALEQLILNDLNPAHPIAPGSFEGNGLLHIPRRGVLKVLPGDWVGVDSRGWPILLSADTIANGAWTHS